MGIRNSIFPIIVVMACATCMALEPAKDDASIDLSGEWRFKRDLDVKTGRGDDSKGWSKPDLNDSGWGRLNVGATWEEQGIDFNGVGWFRRKIQIPSSWEGCSARLQLGKPDDSAEVYLNGETVYLIERFGPVIDCRIPPSKIKAGKENVIAVRVWDWYKSGGLLPGTFSLERIEPLKPFSTLSKDFQSISLQGEWLFQRDMDAKERGSRGEVRWDGADIDDSTWGRIQVGESWEKQGHNFDGVGWYRQRVVVPSQWRGSALRLKMGNPDDAGELYWNGESVSVISQYGASFDVVIPADKIKPGKDNLIAVKVWDWYMGGGLSSGEFSIAKDVPPPKESKPKKSKK